MSKTRRRNKRNRRRCRTRRRGGEVKQFDIMYPDKSYLAPP